jgi:hypothetical protein
MILSSNPSAAQYKTKRTLITVEIPVGGSRWTIAKNSLMERCCARSTGSRKKGKVQDSGDFIELGPRQIGTKREGVVRELGGFWGL